MAKKGVIEVKLGNQTKKKSWPNHVDHHVEGLMSFKWARLKRRVQQTLSSNKLK